MGTAAYILMAMLTGADLPQGGSASGTVKSATGTISPEYAIACVVRDSRNARITNAEVMLTEVPVDASRLRDDLDRHMTAINFDELRDRNYVLLWVGSDRSVRMNATYSKTMTQCINDSSGGLKVELTTNTPAKIEGHVFSAAPLKTMDGPTYTVDVKFSTDVLPAMTGAPLPAGGGESGKAFTAFLGAITKNDWPGIKAGLSPKALPTFEKSYNTPAENLSSAVDILNARLPIAKAKVTGGFEVSSTVVVLETEGDRFGSPSLSLVRMVKTGAVWQFQESAPLGTVR